MAEEARQRCDRRRVQGASAAPSAFPGFGTRRGEKARTRKAALQAALRKKQECEAKALQIVERLLEINVTEEFLLDCVKFITAAHYQDVVEERSIIKQCGYPVCQNALGIVPKQQYKISTKTNRVYDITERKCYCSNFCYKASKYLEAQIPKDPLWAREHERVPPCQLLKEERGSAGEEVRFQHLSIQATDIDNPPIMDDLHVSSSSSSESDSSGSDQEFVSAILLGEKYNLKSAGHKHFKKEQQGMTTKPTKIAPVPKSTGMDHEVENVVEQRKEYHVNNAETSNSKWLQKSRTDEMIFDLKEKTPLAAEQDVPQTTSLTGLKDIEQLEASNVTTQGLSKKGAASLIKLIAKSKQCNHFSSGRSTSGIENNVLELLRQTLIEWNTEETLKFIYGSNLKYKRKQCAWRCQSPCAKEQLDEDDLDSLEVVENIDPNEDVSKNLQMERSEATIRPLPNFEQLKHESKFLHLKVREFYKGRDVFPDNTEGNGEENDKFTTCENRERDPVLPLLDSEAQNQIRKRIVLDALKKVLPNLLGPFQLSISDIFPELNGLVKTFRQINLRIMGPLPASPTAPRTLPPALSPLHPQHPLERFHP
ncbi:putative RNA polymerase II subunit B1 CTD phosphatase rpap2 isoform X3 [Narcine bancroftii]|uniref:putative RNA polymerase II subunit B1 CTD phosphatase rpap2 isoform X3 n=1 Tax=Narcine bancroftii TaxID=1343680 RepID=UPI003831AB9C